VCWVDVKIKDVDVNVMWLFVEGVVYIILVQGHRAHRIGLSP